MRPLARKQGTPRSVTEAHYILATTSLKFRAWFTKFQADMPGVMKHAILLVRLAVHGLWRTWRQRKGYITTSGRASSLLLIICETKHGLAQTGIVAFVVGILMCSCKNMDSPRTRECSGQRSEALFLFALLLLCFPPWDSVY